MSRRLKPLPLFPVEPPQGFDAAKLAMVKANGSPFIVNENNPATVPVPLPVILANVVGKYTERDRKLFRFLVHAAWDELDKKPIQEINLRDVHKVFEEVTGSRDPAWIMDSARRLSQTRIEYKITCGDPRFNVPRELEGEGFAVFLASARIGSAGHLFYQIPADLVAIMKQPLRFARVRVHFIMGLTGKHAVTVYEILEAFVNKDDPSFVVSVDELRKWLNLKPGQYVEWKDFKKRAITPALEQINADPEGAGFSVTMETIKRGKDITHLRFAMTKTKNRTTFDDSMIEASEAAKFRMANPDRPQLRPKTLLEAKKRFPRADISTMERDWFEWWAKTKPKMANPDGAFLKFAATWAANRKLN
jgi:Initiator Replication protein